MAAKKQTVPDTFEERMARLEAIVLRLEASDIPLEESVKLFCEGRQLVKDCRAQLADAQQKIFVLAEDGSKEPLPPEKESSF